MRTQRIVQDQKAMIQKLEMVKRQAFHEENEAAYRTLAEGDGALRSMSGKIEAAERYAHEAFARIGEHGISARSLARLERDLLQALREVSDAQERMADVDRALVVTEMMSGRNDAK